MPRDVSVTAIPAITTPSAIARMLFLLSRLRSHEIRLPVQAPVIGKGTATKIVNAKYP